MGVGCTIVHHVAAFVQIALAVAIAVIVGIKLFRVDVSGDGEDPTVTSTCLLGEDYNNENLCVYVFAVVGVSVLVSFVISLVQCCTCHLCGLGAILDTIFAAAGTAWWIIASSIVTKNSNDSDLPEDGWRRTTVALMWTEVGVFAVLLISSVIRPCLRD
ncbi:hypothetical protein F751_1880 [Auxenochlorella protothecoides]|uniref:MARVEL domain-containing protein n=1 Tax=Auxenochlorella protothecoides TaxID=3075 RepID=A0A087SGZ7_AUXPR|nr:hypothetical protein F751_1880 [Auxenochlorella protothecoides]KFM25001.1 hypothetical protein F751_1880 [Auxenochlorella protothecoides]